MKAFVAFCLLGLFVCLTGEDALGQITTATAYVSCIKGSSGCGFSGSLEGQNFGSVETVIAAGYFAPGDQGGGTFVNMGTTTCTTDGGSIIQDHANNCFKRFNSHWGPKEFGAIGEISGIITDDHGSLQKWLSARQPHVGDTDTYGTSTSLNCPADTTVQGPENRTGDSGPLFQIVATQELGTLGNTQPVIDAKKNCRLSGVAVNGSSDGSGGVATTYTDAVHVDEFAVTIDGFSLLENGAYDLYCNPPGTGVTNGELNVVNTTLFNASNSNFFAPPGSGCENIKLEGDIFNQAAGTAVVFGADEMILANGTIEAAGGLGLDLTSANKVSVTGMNIDANGQLTTSGPGLGAGIKIKNANTISVCANHIEGNGGVNASYSSQIWFDGINDNIDFCANTYLTKTKTDQTLRPSYVYDAASGTVLTNSHFYESAPPQAAGAVYSPNAAAILPQLQVPHVTAHEINGLILSNDSTTLTQVDIAAGEASDSTNATIIQSAGCNVDLATRGSGGLDQGSIASGTTYFYFLIGSASGGSPSCIASASTIPTFINAGAAYHTPTGSQSLTGSTTGTTNLVYNVSSVAGLAVGQTITSATGDIPSGTTISSIGTVTIRPAGSATVATTGGVTTVTVPSTIGMAVGMAVSDYLSYASCTGGTPAGLLNAGGYTIGSITSSTSFQIAPALSAGTSAPNDCITVSGGNTITLSASTTGTGIQGENITVYNGLYRMIGSLYTYTVSGTINVIPFTQDNNTFYLASPAFDVNTTGSPCGGTVTNADKLCALSVPCGLAGPTCNTGANIGAIKVEAFGRVLAGTSNKVLISSRDTSPGFVPGTFSTPPGYTTGNSAGDTAYPFRLYTDTSGKIRLRASTSGAAAFAYTDGWVFQR